MKPRFALLALPLLLAACTGTEESTPNLPLVLLTDGGTTLRTLTPTEDTSSTPFTDVARQTVTGGVSVETLSSGRRFALTRTDGLDSRDLQLATLSRSAPCRLPRVCARPPPALRVIAC
ncbi:hypothetical protein ACFSC4_16755 [Deinococcus malanensis]|uniref:hypothetical protein n=1 Tax=Deinococcus malanensis TaxID=1706855 RepID=UPI0036402147